MARNQDSPELVQALRRPRHEDLTQFAVEWSRMAGAGSELLVSLADWNLYAQAAARGSSARLRRNARSAARRLLRDLTPAMD